MNKIVLELSPEIDTPGYKVYVFNENGIRGKISFDKRIVNDVEEIHLILKEKEKENE